MTLPTLFYLYVAIAAVYAEAALQSLLAREHHRACRELIVTVLYGLISILIVIDPVAMHLVPPTAA